MSAGLAKLVDTVGNALLQIRDMFSDPSTIAFDDVHEEMEKLEAVCNAKALIDAAFAHICERDDAGRAVGAKYANAYLKQGLGLSPKEAYDRLARGKDLFGDPEPEPEDPAEDLFGGEPDEPAAERAPEEREAREAETRRQQAEARKRAAETNAAKQEAIRQELDNLLDAAKHARAKLLAKALREAAHRDINDLRKVVRRWVINENSKHRQPDNPNAGMEKRGLQIGRQRADGLVDISGTMTAGDAALLKALVDKGLVPNSNLPEGVDDYRSPSQRRYDQFLHILKHFDSCGRTEMKGCASVVVSVTLDELADADASTRFSTNTGIELDAFDLVRLGMDGADDFVLTIEGASNVPLNLLRTSRTASIAQRVAMLAIQGVCSWTGCSAPLTECEAHHILAWIQGGNTDIANLTGLCREHHRRNNDHRDHRFNTCHMEHDPETGRAGLSRPGSHRLEYNQSDGARHAAAMRLRHRKQQVPTPGYPPPGQDPDPPF